MKLRPDKFKKHPFEHSPEVQKVIQLIRSELNAYGLLWSKSTSPKGIWPLAVGIHQKKNKIYIDYYDGWENHRYYEGTDKFENKVREQPDDIAYIISQIEVQGNERDAERWEKQKALDMMVQKANGISNKDPIVGSSDWKQDRLGNLVAKKLSGSS